MVILKEDFMAIPTPKKTPKNAPKKKKFPGITDETKKSIEDALSNAMSDDEKNPTSKRNTLKGRNNTLKRKKRSPRAGNKKSSSFLQYLTPVPGAAGASSAIKKIMPTPNLKALWVKGFIKVVMFVWILNEEKRINGSC